MTSKIERLKLRNALSQIRKVKRTARLLHKTLNSSKGLSSRLHDTAKLVELYDEAVQAIEMYYIAEFRNFANRSNK